MTDTMIRPPEQQTPPPYSGQTPPPGEPPSGRGGGGGHRWGRRITGGAVILALIAGGGTAGGLVADHYLVSKTGSATVPTASAGTLSNVTVTDGDQLAAVAAKVSPSIVTLTVRSGNEEALGSGVILNSTGLVLTNNHVVSSTGAGGTVSVTLSSGRTLTARVVATDSTHDLALVQAGNASGLTAATFGPSSAVQVGDTVLAFGSPLGLSGTVTAGIVSALNRTLNTGSETLNGLLQTDAAINEGNSGGALVNGAGQVIGINVAIATASQQDSGSVGLGFAIPSDTVTTIVQQLQAQAARNG